MSDDLGVVMWRARVLVFDEKGHGRYFKSSPYTEKATAKAQLTRRVSYLEEDNLSRRERGEPERWYEYGLQFCELVWRDEQWLSGPRS